MGGEPQARSGILGFRSKVRVAGANPWQQDSFSFTRWPNGPWRRRHLALEQIVLFRSGGEALRRAANTTLNRGQWQSLASSSGFQKRPRMRIKHDKFSNRNDDLFYPLQSPPIAFFTQPGTLRRHWPRPKLIDHLVGHPRAGPAATVKVRDRPSQSEIEGVFVLGRRLTGRSGPALAPAQDAVDVVAPGRSAQRDRYCRTFRTAYRRPPLRKR